MEAREPDLQPTLAGRTVGSYRIEEMLGAGGMGQVYRAWDEKLRRTVAVKVLRGSLERNEIARRRFVRETRMACRVTHPYVAMVLDVVEQGDDLFLVMEYIEGQRLDQVLHESKPDSREVARYGLEIAEALSAIHQAGLVHRDLKPGNVMVTPNGHVKVLDFGVARHVLDAEGTTAFEGATQESTLTAAGAVVGTVRYMSPEQLRHTSIDSRSDLFSLGVILYEALTGAHPFARVTPERTMRAILDEPPSGGETETLTQSGPLGIVVNRLLEKDPERRFERVDEVVTALRGVVEGDAATEALPRPRRRGRLALLLAGLVLVAAVVSFEAWRRRPTPATTSAARPAVAVLPFEDRVTDADGPARAAMVAELLGARLSGSRRLRALDGERVREIVAGGSVDGGTRAVLLAGVVDAAAPRWVVAGSIWREGDSYQARVDVYDAHGPPEAVDSFAVSAASAVALVDPAASGVLRALAPAGEDPEEPSDRIPGSGSEEAALAEYESREALREFRFARAIELLERALALDPQFVSAHVRLADALDRAGYGTRAREAADRARRELERQPEVGQRLRLEQVAIEARIRADPARDIEARRTLTERYADEPLAQRELAEALTRGGHQDEALPVIDTAIAVDPGDPRSHLARARILMGLGRRDDAARALDQAEQRFTKIGSEGGRAQVRKHRGDIAYHLADYVGARSHYEGASEGFRSAGLDVLGRQAARAAADCDLMLGRGMVARARYDELLPAFRQAGNHRTVVDTLSSIGSQAFMNGKLDEAESVLRQALEEGRVLGNEPIVLYPALNLASLLTYVGRLGEGRALAEKSLGVARESGDARGESSALLMLASVDSQQGRLDQAADTYRDLLALQESPRGTKDQIGVTLSGLAEVLEMTGEIGEAQRHADRGVEHERAQQRSGQLGYRLHMRALVRRHLADWDGVDRDLDEARRLSGEGGDALGDLLPRLDLVRGLVESMRGRWDEAERALAAAVEAGAASEAVGLEAPALGALCVQRLETGASGEALRMCRRALEHPRAQVSERTEARAALARALSATGREEEARETALRALEEAESFGLRLTGARAAALLVELAADAEDAEKLRARGATLLAAYLESIDAGTRARVRARPDLARILPVLEPDTESDQATNHRRSSLAETEGG